MRDFKGMKRQRSRNRNGGGGSGGGGGGGKPQQNANRAFDSNGPEGVKVRGAAQHVYEKYQQLARDAHTAGDRVLAENYLQHAEHYFRVMRAMQPQRPLSEIIGRDQFVSGYDIDFEDDGGSNDSGEAESDSDNEGADAGADRASRYEGRRDDFRQGESRPNADTSRADRYPSERQPERPSERANGDGVQADRPSREDRGGRAGREERPRFARDDRARDDRPRDDRVRDDRVRDDRVRDDRVREERPREDRPVRAERQDRADRPERDPLGVIEPEATPLTAAAPRAAASPVLRADDGEISHAPAFLQVRPAEPRAEGAEETRRPRRRRSAVVAAAEAPPATEPEQG